MKDAQRCKYCLSNLLAQLSGTRSFNVLQPLAVGLYTQSTHQLNCRINVVSIARTVDVLRALMCLDVPVFAKTGSETAALLANSERTV